MWLYTLPGLTFKQFYMIVLHKTFRFPPNFPKSDLAFRFYGPETAQNWGRFLWLTTCHRSLKWPIYQKLKEIGVCKDSQVGFIPNVAQNRKICGCGPKIVKYLDVFKRAAHFRARTSGAGPGPGSYQIISFFGVLAALSEMIVVFIC